MSAPESRDYTTGLRPGLLPDKPFHPQFCGVGMSMEAFGTCQNRRLACDGHESFGIQIDDRCVAQEVPDVERE